MASIVDDNMNDDVNEESALFPFLAENEEAEAYDESFQGRGLHGMSKLEPEAPHSEEQSHIIGKAFKATDMLATNVNK